MLKTYYVAEIKFEQSYCAGEWDYEPNVWHRLDDDYSREHGVDDYRDEDNESVEDALKDYMHTAKEMDPHNKAEGRIVRQSETVATLISVGNRR